jgi:hypothetical protein
MNRAQLKELVKNIMSEESEYQAFFQKALEKAGKSIPSMSDDEKKAFFNKIDSAWDGKGEKNEGNAFGAAVTAAKKAGEDEFEVGGETYKVEEELVGGQKKLDVDKDGEIEASDLAALRAGKKANESVNEASDSLKLKGIKINKKSDVTFVLEVSFLIGDEVVMSYLTTGTQQDAQKLKSKVEKAFNAGKIVSPSGIGYYAYNEGMELPKATIPSAVKSKLEMAIDKIKDSNLTYNQKIQVVGQVMDSLGIDKAEFNKMASKLKGTMESVNESRESDILAQIEKLRVAANSGKITGAQFQDKFYPLWKELKTMNKNNESINEENIGLSKGNDNLVMKTLENLIGQDIEYKRKDEKLGKNYYSSTVEFFTKTGFAALSIEGTNLNDDFTVKIKDKGFNSLKNYEVEFVEGEKNAIKMAIGLVKKYGKKYFGMTESVNEGVSSADMDKIKGAVEAANSFMSVGSELKKLGMKYTFATEPLPIYIIQPTPNNKVAIVNKKYATKPDFVVGDIAVGIMESKSSKSVNEGRAFINAARKAKTEGLTEFEFNGKKYPVTIKD